MSNALKHLPPVHELLKHQQISEYIIKDEIPAALIKEWIQEAVDEVRSAIQKEDRTWDQASREKISTWILDQVERRVNSGSIYSLKPVLNGTGTVLHTNLGRARLSDRALAHVHNTSKQYSTLEYNLEEGGRGSRLSLIESLLVKATGAEAAMAVNNNAAAVYMILRALTQDREVIVSRGELIEIGGSFRVSSIMEESGAKLVEVGTTNKTHLHDYESGLSENTAMMMKVHTSNFATVGFTQDVGIRELRSFRDEICPDVLVYEDLGSGSLFPYSQAGVGSEPVVRESLNDGADIVSFSGDKLLGGPQAGIICGKKDLIDKLKKHSLARVLRLDKLTLSALEATLFDYVYDPDSRNRIPALRDILKKETVIKDSVLNITEKLQTKETLTVKPAPSVSKVGGGTMPLEELPTWGLLVQKDGMSVNEVERYFRRTTPPLIVRVMEEGIFIDFRTISEDEEETVIELLNRLDTEQIF